MPVPVSERGLTRDRLSGVPNSRLILRRCKSNVAVSAGAGLCAYRNYCPSEIRLAKGSETKACDRSAAPADL